MNKKHIYIMMLITISILVIPTSIQNTSSAFFNKDKIIKVAIIRQRWDFLDKTSGLISNLQHKRCLEDAEEKYNVNIKVYEFWDNKITGDVQKGKLREKDIDVIIAPGGFGSLSSTKKYDRKIKKFVFLGGGFYGICGDSTYGSLGIKNLHRGYSTMITKLLGIKEISPMLKLANVYTDATVFTEVIKHPRFFNSLDLIKFLAKLPGSRAPIYFKPTDPPIQKPHFGETLPMMLGNAPMTEGPAINNLFMPEVETIAIFKGWDDPYSDTIQEQKAIVASRYGFGKVVLSSVHPELTLGRKQTQDVYIRNILWLGDALPNN